MKLNHECVRDVLLYVEKNCIYEDDPITGKRKIHSRVIYELVHDQQLSSTYNEDDIIYSVVQLFLNDMLIGSLSPFGFNFNYCDIESLSPKGHEFLDNIRDDGIWKKTKEHIHKLTSSVSLSVVSEIAKKVAIGLLAKQL